MTTTLEVNEDTAAAEDEQDNSVPEPVAPKRGRGRPKGSITKTNSTPANPPSNGGSPPVKRGRGRPRKDAPTPVVTTTKQGRLAKKNATDSTTTVAQHSTPWETSVNAALTHAAALVQIIPTLSTDAREIVKGFIARA